MSRIFIVIAFILSIFFMPTPQESAEVDNEILFTNPLFFKAISGNFHSILADKLWLLSNTVSEGGTGNGRWEKDSAKFNAALRTVITLDPYFIAPALYGSTYIVSIDQNIDEANSILEYARIWNKDNFNLYFLQILNYITYSADYNYVVDYNKLVSLARVAYSIPGSHHYLGRIKIDDWLTDIVDFANNGNKQNIQKKADLEWLLKNTTDSEQKKQIQEKLDTLR